MLNIPEIDLTTYNYLLPEANIAQFPLEKRDEAKLLKYEKGNITHTHFFELYKHLPPQSLLVFNNTKVIPARLYFSKPTGALIEVFLLNPHAPALVSQAMQAQQKCIWKCLIGNKKRWKATETLQTQQPFDIKGTQQQTVMLKAEWLDYEQDLITFSWDNEQLCFADLLHLLGEIPLPPYLKRKTTALDNTQYQTVYSAKQGAVAAPTAGLHFTDKVLQDLQNNKIKTDFITLHVSGATFQPIKVDNVIHHPMHAEQLIFTQENIQNLLQHLENIIVVGTTSMRALESLYWFGVELLQTEEKKQIPFKVEKLYPYQFDGSDLPQSRQVLTYILGYMQQHQLKELVGETEIFIFPSYQFRLCKGLITNYHLPATTLMLLVAAFIGEDWQRVYQEALEQNYRFLSYGDSSLLLP